MDLLQLQKTGSKDDFVAVFLYYFYSFFVFLRARPVVGMKCFLVDCGFAFALVLKSKKNSILMTLVAKLPSSSVCTNLGEIVALATESFSTSSASTPTRSGDSTFVFDQQQLQLVIHLLSVCAHESECRSLFAKVVLLFKLRLLCSYDPFFYRLSFLVYHEAVCR